MKLPMWARILIEICAVLLCLVLSFFLLAPLLGDYQLFVLLPGAAIFIYLNPELMSGK